MKRYYQNEEAALHLVISLIGIVKFPTQIGTLFSLICICNVYCLCAQYTDCYFCISLNAVR